MDRIGSWNLPHAAPGTLTVEGIPKNRMASFWAAVLKVQGCVPFAEV